MWHRLKDSLISTAAPNVASLVVLLIVFVSLQERSAYGQSAGEYQVKAVFLYNFAKFVEWPQEDFKTAHDSIGICVAGENPFGGALKEAVDGKTVAGRSLVVRGTFDAKQPGACQILFIPARTPRMKAMLAEAKGDGALTVGEVEGFAEEGGMINFKLVDARVHLEINIAAADRERIRISSKLLELARIVKK